MLRLRQNHPVDFLDDPVVFLLDPVFLLIVRVLLLPQNHPVDFPDDPVLLLVDTLVLAVDPVVLLLELELPHCHVKKSEINFKNPKVSYNKIISKFTLYHLKRHCGAQNSTLPHIIFFLLYPHILILF